MHSPKVSDLIDGRGGYSLCHFCVGKGVEMKNNIRIYEIKDTYIKYLANYQTHIFAQNEGIFNENI